MIIAVVADQMGFPMQGQGDIAVWAFVREAAGGTQNQLGDPSAIQEDGGLFFSFQGCLDFFVEILGQNGSSGFFSWALRSMISTSGSERFSTRFPILCRWYFPSTAFFQVSKLGVAEPKITGQSACFASITAQSRPWYFSFSSCLKLGSCSSSTITSPKLSMGQNRAERAPIKICFRPSTISHHWVVRSRSVS